MARGKLKSPRCSNGYRKKCSMRKCVKKLSAKAKTFSRKKLNAKAKTFTMKKGGKHCKKHKGGKYSCSKPLNKMRSNKKGGAVGSSIVSGLVGFGVGVGSTALYNKYKSSSTTDSEKKSDAPEFNTPSPGKGIQGGKKKSKGKGKGKKKSVKKSSKKSSYSQFLSKELKRVKNEHPDWPQTKVFEEAVNNWKKQ